MDSRRLSRRKFLGGALLSAAGVVLAACQPKTTIVKETVEVSKEKEVTRVVQQAPQGKKQVRILLASWAIADMPFDTMAREYNEQHPELEVKFETQFEGWDTKVLGQMRSGELEWSGAGIFSAFLDIVSTVKTGLVQPMEDLLQSSKQEGAANVLTDMIEPIKEDCKYEGHFYYLPYSFENVTFQYRKDMFAEAGVTTAPKSWEDWYQACATLKEHLVAQGKEDIFVTAIDWPLWRSVGGLICSASDKPYTDEGLIDWDSNEMREVLKFVRRLVWDGFTPPEGETEIDLYDVWQRGRIASLLSCSSRGVWIQNIFGPESAATVPIPTIDGKRHSGSAFWGNSLAVLKDAPAAQEVVDFYVYSMGPQNQTWQKAVIKSGKTPVYKSAYDNILATDPTFNLYKWMIDLRADVEASQPVPRNTYYLIQHTMWNKYRTEYFKPGSKMTEDELIQHILEDTQAEIAKQKL